MICLDTSYLIRFLTKDIPEQYNKVRRLILNKQPKLYVPAVVLAETNYILQKHYTFPKEKVLAALTSLINQNHIITEGFVALATKIYKEQKVSFYDALIIAEAIDKCQDLSTFDKKLMKVYKSYVSL